MGVEFEEEETKEKRVRAVRVEDPTSNSLELLSADVFIFAMGPWSGDASSWFDLPKLSGQKVRALGGGIHTGICYTFKQCIGRSSSVLSFLLLFSV